MGRSDGDLREKLRELEARDAQQRAAIAAYGVDLSKKRVIDLTFWAPDESRAKILVEALTRNELVPNLVLPPGPTETNRRWLVRAPLAASVDFVTTQDNVTTFIMVADKFDCEYDGWGTAIVEAAGQDPS
jgi:hypothetical protein